MDSSMQMIRCDLAKCVSIEHVIINYSSLFVVLHYLTKMKQIQLLLFLKRRVVFLHKK